MEHLILGLYVFVGIAILNAVGLVIIIIKTAEKDHNHLIELLTNIETEEDEWKRPS
jgi:hypothetical protein